MRYSRPILLLACVICARNGCAQVYQEAFEKMLSPAIAVSTLLDRGDGVLWESGAIGEPHAEYVRLHFVMMRAATAATYAIVIMDANNPVRLLAALPASSLPPSGSFYTDPLYSDAVKVRVRSDSPVSDLAFVIDAVLYQKDPNGRLTPQSSVPRWSTLSQTNVRFANAVARSVAKLYVGNGFVCTAFLVGDDAALTNFHCLDRSASYHSDSTGRQCVDIRFQFDYDRDSGGGATAWSGCAGVIDRDPVLDWALLQLNHTPLIEGQKRGALTLTSQSTQLPRKVTVVHHPLGLATRVSTDCELLSDASGLMEHNCSTEPGSSGAPIFDDNGTVVALHFDGAFDDSLTIREIQKREAAGEVFYNHARSCGVFAEAVRKALRPKSQPQ